MRYLLFFLFALTLACSTERSEQAEAVTEEEVVDSVYADTATVVEVAEPIEPNGPTTFDSLRSLNAPLVRIEKVYGLNEKGSFYVELYYNEDHSFEDEETILSTADSVIEKNTYGDYDHIIRRRIPMEVAKKYLDLNYLDTLYFYDRNQQLIGAFRLKQVEYYDFEIGSAFIGVYSIPKPSEEPEIALSERFETKGAIAKKVNSHEIEDRVKSSIEEKIEMEWMYEEHRFEADSFYLAFYSYMAEDRKLKSDLVEYDQKNDTLIQRMHIEEGYGIIDLLTTPVNINERPLLLLRLGYMESDNIWFSPAYFDGKEYVISHSNIVENPYKELTYLLSVEDLLTERTDYDTLIDRSCIVFIGPDVDKIDELKEAYGEEDFYTIADDYLWYEANSWDLIDSLKIPRIGLRSSIVKFQGNNESWTLDFTKKGGPGWFLVLFHKDKPLEFANAIDLTAEQLNEFFDLKE